MEELNKTTSNTQQEMYKEINALYREYIAEITKELESIDTTTNENAIKSILERVAILISTLWVFNRKTINMASTEILQETYQIFNVVGEKRGLLYFTDDKIENMIKTQLDNRQKIVNFNSIIRGNAKKLNKRVNKIVLKGLKEGKTQGQIANILQKQMKFDKNRAKMIATTETNFYKTDAILQASRESGEIVRKTWRHSNLSKEPRQSHIEANGQTVYGADAKFYVGGYFTTAPQHFGIPSQDINCRCYLEIEVGV